MENVTVFNHPLIQHKISSLRDINTGSKLFRELIEEITMLMSYEVFRDLPLEEREIETPICKTITPFISGKTIAIVPVLRAGLGMVNGIHALIPSAKVGHVGLYRDHDTLEPHEYYCKLPENMEDRESYILDPMLATGGSAVAAVRCLKERGCKNIKFLCIIAVPQGIEKLHSIYPDVHIYCGHVDEKLNEIGYIVPGLGDAGDRIFGTK